MLKILKSLIRDAIIEAEMETSMNPNPCAEISLTDEPAKPEICGFNMAWVGYCKEKTPCKKHKDSKCWKCGKPATADCDHAGSLVCGMPYCKDHPHTHGMW